MGKQYLLRAIDNLESKLIDINHDIGLLEGMVDELEFKNGMEEIKKTIEYKVAEMTFDKEEIESEIRMLEEELEDFRYKEKGLV